MANEVRLIDANALVRDHGDDVTNWDRPCAVKISSIEAAPTIDPESLRPKGRWIYKWDAERDPKKLFVRIVCSECNLHTGQKSNYRPNCGAKMMEG